jgi:hypothetical protein
MGARTQATGGCLTRSDDRALRQFVTPGGRW